MQRTRWMLPWVGLLLAYGCNPIFGIRDTVPFDAPGDGPPPDAPPVCPMIGTGLSFSTNTFQLVNGHGCAAYMESTLANLALAQCEGVIVSGPIGGPMSPLDLPAPPSGIVYSAPRLAPEGDRLFVLASHNVSPPSRSFVLFTLVDGVWTVTPATLPVPTQSGSLSMPTPGPERRMLYADSSGLLEELSDDGSNTWPVIATYSSLDLGGLSSPLTPNLSADGLRMVIAGYPHGSIAVLYADRPSLGARFSIPVPIDNAPGTAFPFLTSNCGRLYVDSGNDVAYVTR